MTQTESSTTAAVRPVSAIVDAIETLEGGGFLVHRPFPTATLDMIDPFLLLDEMGPIDVAPGEAMGAPDHPHRGFETVTYMLDGEVEHRDSAGNHGVIGTGDVQWMTAGAGVVHSEMPGARMQREGGRMHGLQLWVNLPRARQDDPAALPGPAARPTSRRSSATASPRRSSPARRSVSSVPRARTCRSSTCTRSVEPDADARARGAVRYQRLRLRARGRWRVRARRRAAHRAQLVAFGPSGDTVRIRGGAERST